LIRFKRDHSNELIH